METNKIYQGDCLELVKQLESNSIDLVITSPPYDNLRDYNGYTFDFEGIAKELYRVVKDGGVCVWVVKDAVIKGNRSLTSFKQGLLFQQIGFNMYDIVIYSKSSASLPHKGRYHDTFEFMFILSKGKPKTINLLKDRKNKYGGTTTWGNKTVREKDGSLTDKGKKNIPEFGTRFNVWEYATGKGNTTSDIKAFEHPAIFPERLAEDHIKSWSNEGDLVLDIMCGSGTTCKMALKNNRKFLGFEISEEYCNIANERIQKELSQSKLNDGDGIPPKPKGVGYPKNTIYIKIGRFKYLKGLLKGYLNED